LAADALIIGLFLLEQQPFLLMPQLPALLNQRLVLAALNLPILDLPGQSAKLSVHSKYIGSPWAVCTKSLCRAIPKQQHSNMIAQTGLPLRPPANKGK
jgi:hypothetical protein